MARPRVTIYNEISIDGRLQGFAMDAGRYYQRGFRWRSDAILMGSVTAQSFGPAESPEEQVSTGAATEQVPLFPGFEHLVYEPKPLLVVPDSRGTVRNWRHAQAQPWYGPMVALVSQQTSPEYLAYLDRRQVDHIVAGEDQVDLSAALEQVNARYGVKGIRTDAGGLLNGALVSAGLADEIAVIVSPRVSGDPDGQSLVRLPHAVASSGVALRLVEAEQLHDGAMWLRYEVERNGAAGGPRGAPGTT